MSCRGPIPDKPRGRPTVPQVAEELRAYYALPHRDNGGCVHIFTEDGNTTQGHADECRRDAEQWGRQWGGNVHVERDVRIATLMAELTGTQRRRLANMSFYPW